MKKHKHKDSEACSTCLAESRRPWYRVRLYTTILVMAGHAPAPDNSAPDTCPGLPV